MGKLIKANTLRPLKEIVLSFENQVIIKDMNKATKEPIKPTNGEIEEALNFPNGWVYCIHPDYSTDGDVPPTAIIGAWKVDANGKIVGEFIHNPNYIEQ